VLLALIDRGLSRDEAYGIVQDAAAAAWDRGEDFRQRLLDDDRVVLSAEELVELFEPNLDHLDAVFARLDKLEVRGGPGGSSPAERSEADQTAALPWPTDAVEDGERRVKNK
jgi:hypothetical protein